MVLLIGDRRNSFAGTGRSNRGRIYRRSASAVERRSSVQVGNLVRRTHARGGIAMAVQAEAHAQRFGVIDLVHLVDRAMALDATDAAVDVDGMVEIDVIRHFVDLHPGDGLARRRAFPYQLQLGAVLQDLVVTVHAGRSGRDVGIPGLFHRAVAVAAIQAELVGMNRVRKGHRLNGLITDPRVFRREIVPHARRYRRAHQHRAQGYLKRKPIGPLWKNVRHSVCPLKQPGPAFGMGATLSR